MPRRGTVPVAAAATFLALIAFTVPLATLPATASALGSGPSGQAWILSSMSVGLGVALLPTGALADELGRRRTLVGGAVLLAVASAGCALAPATAVLVGGRIVAGIGGAALVAASLGLIGSAFDPGTTAARAASGVWAAALGAGIAVGPLLATALARAGGWEAAYWLVTVAAAVLAVGAGRLLTESRAERPRPVDLPGVAVLAAGLALVLVGLVQAREGPLRPLVVALVVGGLVVLGGFVLLERRRAAPMLDVALFASPPFAAVTLAALASGTGIIATTSFLPTVVQRGLGASALAGALVLLAWSATSVITSLLARRLPTRVGPRRQMGGGLAVIAVGQLLLLGADPGSSPWRFVPGLLVAGAASGVVNSALGREAVASVPPGRAAMGSGANNTARYVGSAIGTTVVAVVATRPGLGSGPAPLLAGWDEALVVATVFTLLGALAVSACRPRPAPRVEGGAGGAERADSGHGLHAQPDPGAAEGPVPGGPRVGGGDPQGRR